MAIPMTIMVSANHSYWQLGGCIATGAAQQRQQNACERRLNGCRQTVMHVAGAQHPSQMFYDWESILEWKENPQVRLRSTETRSTYDRRAGRG